MLLLLLACTPDQPSWTPLATPAAWELDLEADPWPEHQPELVDCPAETWHEDLGGLEIQSGDCNHFVAHQPLLAELSEGDPVTVLLWHSTLAAEEEAEAHLALAVDGELLWELYKDIPAIAEVSEVEFDSPLDAPEGAELTLHLHNHGYNTWNFNRLETLR